MAEAPDDRLDALRTGDEEAFVALVRAHHAVLLRVAMANVRDRAVAEEVVQEAWLGALTGADRFQGRCSLRTWLVRITMNIARRRAERIVSGLQAALAEVSSKDAEACGGYAATLRTLAASAGPINVTDDEKEDVEQASFLLEGIRNGFDNADRDTAAELIDRDIERLADITQRCNSRAAERLNS